jgi:hypothetical protein
MRSGVLPYCQALPDLDQRSPEEILGYETVSLTAAAAH